MNTTVKPGRELDALVAEKVMGLRFVWRSQLTDHYGYNAGVWTIPTKWGTMDLTEEPPRYSTDIAAAWEVVEKMREDGFLVALYRSAGAWIADTNPGYGKSDTAPHAICLAALRAVGEDV